MDGFLSFVKSTVHAVGEELKQQAAVLSDGGSGVCYVTRRLIAMPFPTDDGHSQRQPGGGGGGASVALPVAQQGGLTVKQMATFLHKHHHNKFMIWNLSEKTYDYAQMDNQVIEFRFPGFPSPPLSQVFSLCNSLHGWLQADPSNVAVLHCQGGRGRTVCALAWYLAWSGQLPSVHAATQHVLNKLGLTPQIIIPTQARYLDYLANMMEGQRPSTAPLVLERLLMNGIPDLGEEHGCRPYLQIFKSSKLIFSSTGGAGAGTAAGGDSSSSKDLRWYRAGSDDSCVLFPVNLTLEGDILIRIRHLSSSGRPVSLLRFAFHTGFIQPGNTRLTKPQLDGACADSRVPKQFWVDMVFRATPEPDPSTEEGREELERRKKQEEYWEQINQGRKQATTEQAERDMRPPGKRKTGAAAPLPTAQPATTTASSSSATVSYSSSAAFPSVNVAAASKSLGSLFTTASSKLQQLNLFAPTSGSSSSPPSSSLPTSGLDLSNPEVARLHAADEAALAKARRKAATEASVEAALKQPAARSPTAASSSNTAASSSTATAHSSSSSPLGDSFADLQAYVSGLGSLGPHQIEVDSEEEVEAAEQQEEEERQKKKKEKEEEEEREMERQMEQHFQEEDLTVDSDKKPEAHRNNDAYAASSPAPSPPAAAAAAPSSPLLDTDAALEAELAALSAGDDFDLGVDGGEELLLDDADEAALLASLQDEMEAQ